MISMFTVIHGLIFTLVTNGYIFLGMVTLGPRVLGYHDYPEIVKQKVPPQTKEERLQAAIFGIPFIMAFLGFPAYSLMTLKTQLGGEISFLTAFVHLLVLALLAFIGDLVVLDWFIISKITPRFVIIPGSQEEDYKDFSHHYRGHAWATIPLIILCGIIAWMFSSL